MIRDPFAGFLNYGQGIFFAFGGYEQLGVGKLKFDHISGNIDVRITQNFLNECIHERMSFALNDESRFILLKLKYFYYHSTYVGNFGNY